MPDRPGLAADQLRFDGRAALVTGSSQGLGLEYARLLAARGASVVLNGRTAATVEAAAGELRASGARVATAVGDLSTERGCNDVAAQSLAAFGQIDVLIHNAGVSRRVTFTEASAADYRELLGLNLDSTFFITRAIWPHMAARRYGRIVLTSSGAGTFGTRNHALYGMAKGGVNGLVRALAIDAPAAGMAINAITPMAATRLAHNIQDPGLRRDFLEALPPERCAPLVCWLAHESCPLNGELLDLGGGMAARIFTAVAPGYFNPAATLEDIAANAAAIMDETGYAVPRDGEGRAAALIARAREWRPATTG